MEQQQGLVTLRSLAEKFSCGVLDLESYRSARRELLTDILSGKTVLQENRYPPPLNIVLDEQKDTPAQTTKIPSQQQPPAISILQSSGLLLASALALGSIMIVGLLFIYLSDSRTETVPDTHFSAGNEQLNAHQDLISRFLAVNQWNDPALDSFIIEWHRSPVEVLTAIRGVDEYSRLSNAIYKRLLEERALSGLDNAEQGDRKQRRLFEFAQSIGIDDPRFAHPDHESPNSETGN